MGKGDDDNKNKGKGKGKGDDDDHKGKGKGKGGDDDHKGKGKGKGDDDDHKGRGKGHICPKCYKKVCAKTDCPVMKGWCGWANDHPKMALGVIMGKVEPWKYAIGRCYRPGKGKGKGKGHHHHHDHHHGPKQFMHDIEKKEIEYPEMEKMPEVDSHKMWAKKLRGSTLQAPAGEFIP